MGGTCLHNGCIPTKALLHAAELADDARHGAQFGVHTTLDHIDMNGVNEYKGTVVARLYKGLQGLIKSRKITVFEGFGKLVAPDAVEVNGERITGQHIVLGTGSYARSLPGLEIGGRVITSDQALQLDWVPKSVIVLGGGVIGSEFASVWKSFGADVTIIEALPHLLANEDEALSKAFERQFRKRGINFNLGVRFAGVTQNDDGVHVSLEDGKTFDADLLLVAVGRGPRTSRRRLRGAGHHARPRLRHHRRAPAHRRRQHLRRRRHRPRPAARAPRVRAGHLRRRGDRRPQARRRSSSRASRA